HAAVTTHTSSQFHRLVIRTRSGNDSRIHASSPGPVDPLSLDVAAIHGGEITGELSSQRTARGHWIDARHTAPGTFQDLHERQPDQSEADDEDRFSQAKFSGAHGLDRNRSDRHEGSFLQRNARWNHGCQIDRNADNFRMDSVPAPGAGDPVAHLKALRSRAYLNDMSRRAVPQSKASAKVPPDGVISRHQSVSSGLLDYPGDQVGPTLRLTQETLSGKLDGVLFCSPGNQRIAIFHQNVAVAADRSRNLNRSGLSGLD